MPGCLAGLGLEVVEIERQNKEYADKIWAQYRQQYHVTLPGVVKEYAPGTFYWPSSPFAFEREMSGTTDGGPSLLECLAW